MIKTFIVDDHILIREGLKQILDDAGDFEIAGEASNTKEALDLLSHADCDIVLLDISLPGRDGLELMEIIKQFYPEIHVLILSMYPEEHYAIRSLRAGASGYLTKDNATEALINVIHTILERGRYISPAIAELLAAHLDGSGSDCPHNRLSNRELDIMKKIAAGNPVRKIAGELSLSPSSVNSYRTSILKKMNVKSDIELTIYAIRNKLIE